VHRKVCATRIRLPQVDAVRQTQGGGWSGHGIMVTRKGECGTMSDPISARIRANPRFQDLTRRRTHMAWLLFGVTMTLFFGLILVVAFLPGLLATPLGPDRVTSIGWPIGAALIVFSWLLTAFYVWRANAETENTRQIIAEAIT
jgi:uncharacterized membrane protein (DUF485 family)